MNAPDISSLVKGVLAIIGLAIAIGQYPALERWARTQAIEALEWKEGLPYFFAAPAHATQKRLRAPYTSGVERGGRQ